MRPAPKQKATPNDHAPRTLMDFVRDKRRAHCRLCALPESVREELKQAREKKIHREVQMEWLKSECGVTVTTQELDMHRQGRHDYI